MARMAALSAAGSFAQAVTTWDKSCPALTRLCEATCEGETVLAASLLGSWRVRAPPLPPLFEAIFGDSFRPRTIRATTFREAACASMVSKLRIYYALALIIELP